MEFKPAPYTFPVVEIARQRGELPTAGVFLLGDRCHFAPYHTAAADALLARGALHVGTLRFDRDPLERTHADRAIRRLPAGELVDGMKPAPGPN